MRTVNLADGDQSIAEIIALAKSEPVLLHAADGTDFVIEEADRFEREVAALGASDTFMSFLEKRSKEEKELSAPDAAKRLGINSEATHRRGKDDRTD